MRRRVDRFLGGQKWQRIEVQRSPADGTAADSVSSSSGQGLCGRGQRYCSGSLKLQPQVPRRTKAPNRPSAPPSRAVPYVGRAAPAARNRSSRQSRPLPDFALAREVAIRTLGAPWVWKRHYTLTDIPELEVWVPVRSALPSCCRSCCNAVKACCALVRSPDCRSCPSCWKSWLTWSPLPPN